MFYLYILRCDNHHLYIGVTNNLKRRIRQHRYKQCAHTKKFRDIELVYSEEFDTKEKAQKREQQLKNWTRAKKEALIRGDMNHLRQLSKRRNY